MLVCKGILGKTLLSLLLFVLLFLVFSFSHKANAFTLNSLPSVMSSPPTVTLNTTSSITDGVFKDITGSEFRNYGHRLGQNSTTQWQLGVSTTPNLNTPGASANAAPYAIEWQHTGSVFEIHLLGNGATYKLLVDGQYTTSSEQTIGATDYQERYLKVDFGSSATRTIRLETANYLALDGIVIGPSDSVSVTSYSGPRVIVLGDSFTEGQTGSVNVLQSFVQQLGLYVGWNDIWGSGSGGTGYVNPSGGAGRTNFIGRVENDVEDYDPDWVIVAGGFNDANAYSASDIQSSASALFSRLRANLPDAKLVVVGPWSYGGSVTTNLANTRNAVKAAAAPHAHLFIDPHNGKSYINDVATSSAIGQWITTSNASTYISSDGVHPTASGHNYLGQKIAQAISDAGLIDGVAAAPTPEVPTNFAPSTSSTSSVSMTWSDVDHETKYELAWRRSTEQNYTTVNLNPGVTSHTITGLDEGTTVFAYLRSCINTNCSAYAGFITLTSDTTAQPEVPTNFVPGSFTNSSVTMNWTDTSNETKYQVVYRRSTESTYTTVDVNANSTSYTINSLTEGTIIYAYVRACINTNCSAYAGYITLTAAVPTVPANFEADSSTTTSVSMTWDDTSNETKYQIAWRRSTESEYTTVDINQNSTDYTINSLTTGTTVFAYLRACANTNCSAWTDFITLETQ